MLAGGVIVLGYWGITCARAGKKRGATAMKVLLADLPAKGSHIDDSYSNLGLLYLAGTLKSRFNAAGISVDYLGPRYDLREHVDFVKGYKPDVYGVGVYSKGASLAVRTLQEVRTAVPSAKIVIGGNHPTALPEDMLKKADVDAIVMGEGEETLSDLVSAFYHEDSPKLEGIAGLVLPRNGEAIYTEKRPLIADLDSIPFPAWELIDFADYPGMFLKKQKIESSLLISRGCPFQCSFCSQPVWKYQKPWLRSRSPENICEEIHILYERGVREIYLSSDELNFSLKWALDLCWAIASLGYKDLYFQCNMRADKITEELATALAEMNCWLVHLGIESASNRVLNGIGKKVTIEQIEHATELLSGVGIRIFAFMMLYQVWEEVGRLCFETPEEVANSLRWAHKMYRSRKIHYMSWQYCTPLPGAELYDIAERHDLYLGEKEKVWEDFDEHKVCMRLPGVPLSRMKKDLKRGILLKDYFMLRSGAISMRHLWRARENIGAIFR